jgi:AraC family transcriptional regulator, transcriptional activator of pobA
MIAQHPSFEIHTLEWLTINRPNWLTMPRKTGHFEIIWIMEGEGTYNIDLEKHKIRENVICCIDVGQVHVLQAGSNIRGYYISFSPQFLYLSEDNTWPLFENRGYARKGMAGIIPVDEELQFEMEEIVVKLIKEFAGIYCMLRSEIIKGLLKIGMIYLARKLEVKEKAMAENRNNELVRKFMALLESNVTKRKLVSDYAGELGMTPNHLNGIIKKTTGFPVNYHIQQRKVLEAKRQVIYYGISMKQIAYYLGFDDLAHFSKFFKTNTGSSFKNFRKEIAGEYQAQA